MAQPGRVAEAFPEAAPPPPHRGGGTHTDAIFGNRGSGSARSARPPKPEFGSGVRDLPAIASFPSAKRVGGAAGVETGGGGERLYVYRWGRMGRKGELCHVLARGKMNSCLVEFLDGYTAITSRNAVKRATDAGARS